MTIRKRLALAAGLGALLACIAQVSPASADNTYPYLVYGEKLDMSYGGPAWDRCHHYVHFSYPQELDAKLVPGGVAIFGPGNPSAWGTPSNGQLNAGYHYGVFPAECKRDTTNNPRDFKLWLTVKG